MEFHPEESSRAAPPRRSVDFNSLPDLGIGFGVWQRLAQGLFDDEVIECELLNYGWFDDNVGRHHYIANWFAISIADRFVIGDK